MMTLASLPQNIDSTMISCFRSCPQKFYREFVQGLRPPGISIDLHAGACFASAMENVYKGVHEHNLSLPDALTIAHAKFMIEWGDFVIPEYKRTAKTKDRTWEAVEDYFTQYPPITDHIQPYFLNGKPTFETTFAIPLEEEDGFPLHPETGQPFLYSGRLDCLGAYLGRPVAKDDKTTGGSISTGWAEKWNLRSQFLGYCWALQQMGIEVDTVVVRGIAIQKTQIVHAEAIKPYSQALIERWYNQLRRDMNRLVNCWKEEYFDYNLADACTSFGSCIFLPMCESPTPDIWINQYEVRHWNPLLRDPTKDTGQVGDLSNSESAGSNSSPLSVSGAEKVVRDMSTAEPTVGVEFPFTTSAPSGL